MTTITHRPERPVVTRFPNGYEASVISEPSGRHGLFEVAAFVGSTAEVVSTKGWLTAEEATAEVDRIGALPPHVAASAPRSIPRPDLAAAVDAAADAIAITHQDAGRRRLATAQLREAARVLRGDA